MLLTGVSFLLFSCSSGKSLSEYQGALSRDAAKSQSTNLKVKIPLGWFTALDNENHLIDLWLIKDDYSALLNFTIINIDGETVRETGGNILEAALKYSKKFKEAAMKKEPEFEGEDEYFTLSGNQIGAYKYKNKTGALVRVALFRYQNKIYELTAVPSPKADSKPLSSEELFFIQDAVLSSIE